VFPRLFRRGGWGATAQELAERSPLPVTVDASAERLPAVVEATGYFVIADALTNVAKHARARAARVLVALDGNALKVQIDDDGNGGADPSGSGLVGLADRVAALDGVLDVRSAPGSGTRIAATIPLLGRA
jgi:signal transduction histidine kinase